MKLSDTQQLILDRIKTRGPQSVNILANQLSLTKMGIRQHLQDLELKGLLNQTPAEKQTRGRPVCLWALTKAGHQSYPNFNAQLNIEIIDVLRDSYGDDGLKNLTENRNIKIIERYQAALASIEITEKKLGKLAQLRTAEGYLAQIRLIPKGWLLIENHCPIFAAAEKCRLFCDTELDLFQAVLGPDLEVQRSDHLLDGARRCAYIIFKTTP